MGSLAVEYGLTFAGFKWVGPGVITRQNFKRSRCILGCVGPSSLTNRKFLHTNQPKKSTSLFPDRRRSRKTASRSQFQKMLAVDTYAPSPLQPVSHEVEPQPRVGEWPARNVTLLVSGHLAAQPLAFFFRLHTHLFLGRLSNAPLVPVFPEQYSKLFECARNPATSRCWASGFGSRAMFTLSGCDRGPRFFLNCRGVQCVGDCHSGVC